MGLADWIAIAGTVFLALSALCGGVWWMASLHALVRRVADSQDEVLARLDQHGNEIGRIDRLDWRVTRLEGHDERNREHLARLQEEIKKP